MRLLHYFIMFTITSCILFTACGDSEKDQLIQQITTLEAKQDSLDLAGIQSLLGKYNDYIGKYPEDAEWSSRYLYRSASFIYRSGNYPKTIELLKQSIRDYPKAEVTPNCLLLLASITEEEMRDEKGAKRHYQQFIDDYPNHAQIETAKFFFKPKMEKINAKITEYEAQVYQANPQARVDPIQGRKLIYYYESFAQQQPKDPKTPEYLYKGAEIARSIPDAKKALDLWTMVYQRYKDYDKAPQSLFMQGYIYENDYRNLESAKEKYEAFLKEYPKHELADDVQFSLKFLGKPAEEIIKQFEEKNKKSSK